MRTGRLLLLASSAVLSCCGGELLYRWLARAQYTEQLRQFRSDFFESTPQRPYLYRLRADLDLQREIRDPASGIVTLARYRTNADGLRWHAVWPPPATATRILFVGDSYTFGTAVQDGESFPHCAESELRARGLEVAAINAGVPGYDSEQELALLAELLPRHRPALAVVAYVLNDTEPPTSCPLPPELLYRDCRSWLLEDLRTVGNAIGRLTIGDAPLLQRHRLSVTLDYRESHATDQPKWLAVTTALLGMRDLCRSSATPLLLAVLPDFTERFDATYRYGRIHDQLTAFAAANGIEALDLLPALRQREASRLRVPGDGHPNREGQRLLGTLIAERLAARLGRG